MNSSDRHEGKNRARKGVHAGVHQEALELLQTLTEDHPRVRDVARRLVELSARGRTSSRAVVAALESLPDAKVVQTIREMAGIDEDVSMGRLVRLAQGRADEAMRRTNPVACNEGFVCLNCGTVVSPATGGFQRNHCPHCLYSLHVDVVPGDRLNPCRGLMEPTEVERAGADRVVILHRCQRCGSVQRVKAAQGTPVQPDSARAIRALAAAPGTP